MATKKQAPASVATNEATMPAPAPEQKSDITALVEIAGLTLSFRNGKRLWMGLSDLSETIARQATLHGLKQKLVDAAAIARNTETGRSATIDDKFEAVNEVYERLLVGQWNKPRESGEGSGGGALLFRALCALYPARTPDALREFIAKLTPEQQTALRRTKKVADAIEALRPAPKTTVDTDALLGELAGNSEE